MTTPALTPPVIVPPPELVSRAAALGVGGGRAILGITGAPGSGKTTFALAIRAAVAALPGRAQAVVHLPMDGYHLADVELDRLGRRDAKGAVDTFDGPGYLALLERVRRDGPDVVYAPAFDRELEQPIAGSIPVLPAARLVITEGIHLLAPEYPWPLVQPLLDELWYVEVDPALRRQRLLDRHVRFGKTPEAAAAWIDAVDEPNAARLAAARDRADLVVLVD